MTNEEWAEAQASPDAKVFTFNGHPWSRTHPKQCAQCGLTFFAYRREDADEWAMPYRVDPEPGLNYGIPNGMRGTCGRIACYEAEDKHQLARNRVYLESLDRWKSRMEAKKAETEKITAVPGVPKLKRFGG